MSRYNESYPAGQTIADVEKGSGYDFAERTIRLGFIRKVFGECLRLQGAGTYVCFAVTQNMSGLSD